MKRRSPPIYQRLRLTGVTIVVATVLAGSASLGTNTGAAETTITVATLNVHDITEDGEGPLPWAPRRAALAQSIRAEEADVIGFQEMETFAGSSWSTSNRQRD